MPDSLYLILLIVGLAIIGGLWTYADWITWNAYRKLERRAHRNLMRQAGR